MVRLYLKYSSRKRVCAEKAARNNMLLSHHSVSKLQSTITAPIAAMITIQPRVRGYSRKTRPSFTALLFSLIASDSFFSLLFISSISVCTLPTEAQSFLPASPPAASSRNHRCAIPLLMGTARSTIARSISSELQPARSIPVGQFGLVSGQLLRQPPQKPVFCFCSSE